METSVISEPKPTNWRKALAEAVRSRADLAESLGLATEDSAATDHAANEFPLLAPRSFIARIRHGDPADPLLRQIMPDALEAEVVEGFSADPLDEFQTGPAPGLLVKYPGRALLVTTGACAIHCRYCFRRHFPYSEGPKNFRDWAPAFQAIADDSTIHEVLLSGGDPLTRTDDWLAELADRLAAIPHLRRLRVHTRLPIVLPERVNDELLAWMTGTRLPTYVVVHANHPREIDENVAAALARLVDAGIPVLNQSVLLRGVNDDAETLAALCERLVDLRVSPYYLHQLDHVAGAAHFAVSEERGREIVAELQARLPGYAVPRYVREIPGEFSKTPV